MARILIIDDTKNIRNMMQLTLEKAGHQIETAEDGEQGLALFGDGERWDLMLLDQRMPGMEGLEVLAEMKKRDASARVVMMTAFGTIDLAAAAMKAGATDFLRKPFTTDALRSEVQTALEGACRPPEIQNAAQRGAPLSAASINGFRILSGDANINGAESGGAIRQAFSISGPQGETRCEVLLPGYFTELVKAHADREQIPDAPHFWLWLSEEALANYLWQNAEVPAGGVLQVDELTTGLRRWVDAVLTR